MFDICIISLTRPLLFCSTEYVSLHGKACQGTDENICIGLRTILGLKFSSGSCSYSPNNIVRDRRKSVGRLVSKRLDNDMARTANLYVLGTSYEFLDSTAVNRATLTASSYQHYCKLYQARKEKGALYSTSMISYGDPSVVCCMQCGLHAHPS